MSITPHYTITRDQARAAGRVTDALVAIRDKCTRHREPHFAEVIDELIGLPTHVLVDLADALGIGAGQSERIR